MFKNPFVGAALSSTGAVDVERDANSTLSRVHLVVVTRRTQKPTRTRPRRLTNGKPYHRLGRAPAKISSCIRSPISCRIYHHVKSPYRPGRSGPTPTTIGVFLEGTSYNGILYRAGYERSWVNWAFEGSGSVSWIVLVVQSQSQIEIKVKICIEDVRMGSKAEDDDGHGQKQTPAVTVHMNITDRRPSYTRIWGIRVGPLSECVLLLSSAFLHVQSLMFSFSRLFFFALLYFSFHCRFSVHRALPPHTFPNPSSLYIPPSQSSLRLIPCYHRPGRY